MMNIASRIEKILPLSGSDLELFVSKFYPMQLKKGAHFIKEGRRVKEIGFILSGCTICYYLKDGKEIIDGFACENEFVTDYFSILNHIPAQRNVKCLEDTAFAVVNYEDIQRLYDTSSCADRIGRIIAEGLFMRFQEKTKSLLLDDAQTRYLKLLKQDPEIIRRVPQYLVASYLNIKPETLSRIRKRLSLQTTSRW